MRKPYVVLLSTLLVVLGSWLMIMGIIHGSFSQEQDRSLVNLTLMGGFAVVLLVGLSLSRITAQDYRTVYTTAISLLSLGLLLLGVFFGLMGMMVDPGTYGVLLAVFLVPYGLALIMNGVAHYFLSQQVYRLYFFDFMRSFPQIYRRYRI